MNLILINGSPRLEKSASYLISKPFIEGFCKTDGNNCQIVNLYNTNIEKCVEIISSSEVVMISMPLYTDSMPSKVTCLLESVQLLNKPLSNVKMLFLLQSGLSEVAHLRGLEKYLVRFTQKNKIDLLGVIIKPHGNRIDEQPPWDRNSLNKKMQLLGLKFGQTGTIDRKITGEIASPEQFAGVGIFIVKMVLRLFGYRYFDNILKKNGSFKKRYDKPYYNPDFFVTNI